MDNRKKDKNPILTEIEQDNAPIPVPGETPATPNADEPETVADKTLSELLAKKPEELSAAEMDTLNKYKDDLTDEQKVQYGLADESILDPKDEKPPVVAEPAAPAVPPVTPAPVIAPEQQLAEQQREAQILHDKNKKITEIIDNAANLPEPTEDELRSAVRTAGADWDDLSEFEKNLFKTNLMNDRRFKMVQGITNDIHQIDAWAKKVDDFIEADESNQKFKELSGHEAEFRAFAMKESHRGADLELLINAFLHGLPPVTKKAGELFPVGGGAAPEQPKSDVISDASEAGQLKISNPREYARKLKAGKIQIEV